MIASWLIWSLIAALALTCYNTLFRMASTANVFLFLMVANGVAFLSYFAIGHFVHRQNETISQMTDSKVILIAIATSIAIVAVEISIFCMLKSGSSGLSLGFPTMNILTLLFTLGIGLMFFKENISWQNGFGIVFGLLSVWLLAYKKV